MIIKRILFKIKVKVAEYRTKHKGVCKKDTLKKRRQYGFRLISSNYFDNDNSPCPDMGYGNDI